MGEGTGVAGGLVCIEDGVTQGTAFALLGLSLLICELGAILIPAWFSCYEH